MNQNNTINEIKRQEIMTTIKQLVKVDSQYLEFRYPKQGEYYHISSQVDNLQIIFFRKLSESKEIERVRNNLLSYIKEHENTRYKNISNLEKVDIIEMFDKNNMNITEKNDKCYFALRIICERLEESSIISGYIKEYTNQIPPQEIEIEHSVVSIPGEDGKIENGIILDYTQNTIMPYHQYMELSGFSQTCIIDHDTLLNDLDNPDTKIIIDENIKMYMTDRKRFLEGTSLKKQ